MAEGRTRTWIELHAATQLSKKINIMKNTYLYAFLFGFFDRLLWGDGFGYSHDTDAAWNEWYDTGANWADKLPERVQVWFYQINNKR